MLVKLRISNENEFYDQLKQDAEYMFLTTYEELITSISKDSIPMTLRSYRGVSCEFCFNGLDKKTNTYYYEFIKEIEYAKIKPTVKLPKL